jgi:biopolymer transport protein ExbB
MLIQIAAAAGAANGAAAHAGGNPYGFWAALEQGGAIAWAVFLILATMSVFSLYILFTKLFEQNKVINQGKAVDANFWRAPTLRRRCCQARKEQRLSPGRRRRPARQRRA